MKTRLVSLIVVLCCVFACAAVAQDRWRSIPAPQWGFAFRLPPGAAQQPYPARADSAMCDLYTAGGFCYLIEATPTPSDALASTLIEQTIQADIKEAAKLGAATRWEATSKQGDLFKGFTGPVQYSNADSGHAAVIKTIGAERGVSSVALAALGDESGPVIKISVVGPTNREGEVAAMAKTVSSLVTTMSKSAAQPTAPKPAPAPAPPTPQRPDTKPWPALVNGKIELVGIVESVSGDGKALTMTVDLIKMPGQEPIALDPKRSKKVILRHKLNTLAKGLHIRLIGRNDGVGKPINAEAVELTPDAPAPEPETGPPSPMPLT